MKTIKIVSLLIAVVTVANTMVAQTLVNETFGSSAIVAPYTGGTSTTPSGIAYTRASICTISTALNEFRIFLKSSRSQVYIYFYDMSGRLIEKQHAISNSVQVAKNFAGAVAQNYLQAF